MGSVLIGLYTGPLDTVVSQMNLIHNLNSCLLTTNYYIIFPPTFRSSTQYLSLKLSDYECVSIYHLFHETRLLHFILLDLISQLTSSVFKHRSLYMLFP
jgi:hypothetical protein